MATEIEVTTARRAFPMAQEMLAGAPFGNHRSLLTGWYGSTVHRETGAFACVGAGVGQDDLIGEIVQVTYGGRSCFVYVMQAVSLPPGQQLALARRAFAALSRLSSDPVLADVVPVQG